jgi:hypothetical protein
MMCKVQAAVRSSASSRRTGTGTCLLTISHMICMVQAAGSSFSKQQADLHLHLYCRCSACLAWLKRAWSTPPPQPAPQTLTSGSCASWALASLTCSCDPTTSRCVVWCDRQHLRPTVAAARHARRMFSAAACLLVALVVAVRLQSMEYTGLTCDALVTLAPVQQLLPFVKADGFSKPSADFDSASQSGQNLHSSRVHQLVRASCHRRCGPCPPRTCSASG